MASQSAETPPDKAAAAPPVPQGPASGPAARRRQLDEVLFATATGAPAVVLCGHAGKEGKRARTDRASLGATLCWLVDPALNNLLARFERHGAVRRVEAFMAEGGALGATMAAGHVAGHATYVDRVVARLPPEMASLWQERFGAGAAAAHRKYGNAAVGTPSAVKCLHALTAQALGGAPNPVGCAVARYIVWLASPAVRVVGPGALSADDGATTAAAAADGDGPRVVAVDDLDAFFAWLLATGDTAFTFGDGGATQAVPGVCEAAAAVLVAAEGHAPRPRKKHRVN